MDIANSIKKVIAPEYKKVTVDMTDGNRYSSDLSTFTSVYCFPKNISEWASVSIDPEGLNLCWSGGFEVHLDQVIALAFKVERLTETKSA